MRDPFLDDFRDLRPGMSRFAAEREEEWESMPAHCPWPVHKVITGFPRYNFSVTSLPLAQRAQLNEIAGLILQSFQQHCKPMLGVLIIGHADRDLQRGPAFEYEISVKRALSARNALRTLITAQGRRLRIPRGAPGPSSIDWQYRGDGTTRLLVPNASSEPDRARNRRVEVLLALRSYPSQRSHA